MCITLVGRIREVSPIIMHNYAKYTFSQNLLNQLFGLSGEALSLLRQHVEGWEAMDIRRGLIWGVG